MKSFILSTVVLICSVCCFAFGSSAQAHLSWIQGPQVDQESVLRLQFIDTETQQPTALSGELKVTIFMPMMGHGSSPTTVTAVKDTAGNSIPGAYQISKIYFTMIGEWEVRITLKNADGTSQTQTVKVNL
jgi:hypothetical protein